jgi:hypothetical protein
MAGMPIDSDFNPYAAPEEPISARPADVDRSKAYDPDGGTVWREGKMLVSRIGEPLPDRCVRCNAPAEGFAVRRKYTWHPELISLLVLLSPPIYVIVALLVRKKAVVDLGYCLEHHDRRRAAIRNAWLTALTGLVLIGLAIPFESGPLALAGLAVLLISLFMGALAPHHPKPKRIDKQIIRLAGVGKPFLDSLPGFNY